MTYPQQSVYQQVQNQVKKIPHQTAIQFGDQVITYNYFNQLANRIAYTLLNHGCRAGNYVVLYANRHIETLAAILAIFKIGAVYIPIDTALPLERVYYILKETQCQFICTQTRWMPSLKAMDNCHTIELNKVAQHPYQEDSLLTPYNTRPDELAYVIYTSGSTGTPKGVMVSHGSLTNLLNAMITELELTHSDTWLAHTSLSFDISLAEIFLPLITGAQCFLANTEQHRDPRWIHQTLNQHAITCFQATPTLWQLLFDHGYQPNLLMKAITTGEALTPIVAQKLKDFHRAWNLYGPTETTIWSTCGRLDNIPTTASNIIGKPIANTKIYLLDSTMQPVPIGKTGELYISGLGVAKGYVNQPELTADRFVLNPFSQHPSHCQLYKTGDLACWLPDGQLCYQGSVDHRFKIRGYRIEAGKIESILLQYPTVHTCIVTVETQQNTPYLVAYLTLEPEKEKPTKKALRTFLATRLPDYMLPDQFIILKSLPKTVSNKIDFHAFSNLSKETNRFNYCKGESQE